MFKKLGIYLIFAVISLLGFCHSASQPDPKVYTKKKGIVVDKAIVEKEYYVKYGSRAYTQETLVMKWDNGKIDRVDVSTDTYYKAKVGHTISFTFSDLDGKKYPIKLYSEVFFALAFCILISIGITNILMN